MACPKCGREINHEQFPLGLTFCPYCGDKVSRQDQSQNISFCPYCGRRLQIAATFCPECGKQIIHGAANQPYVTMGVVPTFSGLSSPPRIPLPPETDGVPQITPEESPPPAPSPSIWPKITYFCKRVYEPIESLITGRWRLKRLYKDWSVHDALPPDEIPNDDYLKNMPRQTSSSTQRLPLWMILMATVGAVLIFVAIGILIGRA